MKENLKQYKSSVPPPPPPLITIRTMESDIQALEQGGGEIGHFQSFNLPEIKSEEEPIIETKINIGGYTGPEKPIFNQDTSVLTEKATEREEAFQEETTHKWKSILVIIGILVIVVGLGLLGYFVVSRWIFPQETPAAQ